jgi:hypothetical protein
MNSPLRIILTVCWLFSLAGTANADERLKGIACRSVHLGYPAAEGTVFYNEIKAEQSAPGTYFCVCGFGKGYYGIQELANGKKLLIFSVWDPGKQNDPNVVEDDRRVKLLYQDKAVRIGRFGNEGTGGQSFLDYDWKIGETYRLMVTAKKSDKFVNRTEYTSHFFVPETKTWKKLVTFSTITKGRTLFGHYAFVEDFRRNRVSATKVRKAVFGNGWLKSNSGEWSPLTTARFTADANPVTNIDAGPLDGRFFLATGGKTENKTTVLRKMMELPKTDAAKTGPPQDVLDSLKVTATP